MEKAWKAFLIWKRGCPCFHDPLSFALPHVDGLDDILSASLGFCVILSDGLGFRSCRLDVHSRCIDECSLAVVCKRNDSVKEISTLPYASSI